MAKIKVACFFLGHGVYLHKGAAGARNVLESAGFA